MISYIKTKMRKTYMILNNQVKHLKPAIKINKKWYGNSYGGFYVCQDFISSSSIIYSFGIGEDISFDIDLIKNHNCSILAFDPTPKSINWVNQQKLPLNFSFFQFGLAEKSGLVNFFLPKNSEHVSGSFVIQDNVNRENMIPVKMKSFPDIIKLMGHKNVDILKIDIEGAEYDVLDSILNTPVEIKQILIEFHDRLFPNGKTKTVDAIQKMKDYGYVIFGVSDSFQEISFIKKQHGMRST